MTADSGFSSYPTRPKNLIKNVKECDMRSRSTKEQRVSSWRRELRESVGKCEICGHSPGRPWRDRPLECSELCCHEILCGPDRQRAIDKPFAILVLCGWCNMREVTDKTKWPVARQLCIMKIKSPDRYDLRAFLELRNPNALNYITEDEVDAWDRTDSLFGNREPFPR